MDEAKRRLRMSNPWHLLATGFGSGLSPVMPGTMGSLAAIPFWLLLIQLPWQLYSLTVMFSICIGVYICHRTAKDMKVHDHGSIVWDEFVGMWITLMALPVNDWRWVAAGFVIFRILDMWKPWPIRWFDRNVAWRHGHHGRRYHRRRAVCGHHLPDWAPLADRAVLTAGRGSSRPLFLFKSRHPMRHVSRFQLRHLLRRQTQIDRGNGVVQLFAA